MQVLRMLAWGYTSIEINGQRALNCIVHLRQLDQSVEDAVIGYVALKAYIELKKYPEARTEFMGLLTASDVPLAIYSQAITVRATAWLKFRNEVRCYCVGVFALLPSKFYPSQPCAAGNCADTWWHHFYPRSCQRCYGTLSNRDIHFGPHREMPD
jgi:hypothetical protein